MAQQSGVTWSEIMAFDAEYDRKLEILYEKRNRLSKYEFYKYMKSLAQWAIHADRVANMPAGQIIRQHALNIIETQDELDADIEQILYAIGYTAQKFGGEWVVMPIPRELREEIWKEARGRLKDKLLSPSPFDISEPDDGELMDGDEENNDEPIDWDDKNVTQTMLARIKKQ